MAAVTAATGWRESEGRRSHAFVWAASRGQKRCAPVRRRRVPAPPEEAKGTPLLALLLAMAMFVLVVDASLMNV